jgi:hypothetical protein
MFGLVIVSVFAVSTVGSLACGFLSLALKGGR